MLCVFFVDVCCWNCRTSTSAPLGQHTSYRLKGKNGPWKKRLFHTQNKRISTTIKSKRHTQDIRSKKTEVVLRKAIPTHTHIKGNANIWAKHQTHNRTKAKQNNIHININARLLLGRHQTNVENWVPNCAAQHTLEHTLRTPPTTHTRPVSNVSLRVKPPKLLRLRLEWWKLAAIFRIN